MNPEIYYFSGTGNSLSIAKKIKETTNGKLVSISSVMKQDRIRPQAEQIGIVFPCYLAQLNGIPLVVQEFVKKLEGLEAKYVFAVCTCGGYECVDALPTLKRFRSLISATGGRLSAEFSVRLPMNNLSYFFFQTHNHEKMFKKSEKKVAEIAKCIMAGRRNKFDHVKTPFNYLMTPMYIMLRNFYLIDLRHKAKEPKDSKKKYYELIPLTDRSIFADEKCNGCSMCAKVCPVRNIEMSKKRPVWQNHCEMCMACVEWCPQDAVHHWNIKEGLKYHHPDISVRDMLGQIGDGEIKVSDNEK